MSNPVGLLALAAGEVGYKEGYSNGHWNNSEKYAGEVPGLEWANGQAWCATFVSWLALKSGNAALYPRTASCSAGVQWFKDRGRFSAYPAVGAQVFYGPGGGDHTGVVESFDADYIYTIEGNTNTNGSAEGDGVYRKKRLRRSDNVYGYGYPKFSEGIKSADPNFHDVVTVPPVPVPVVPKPVPKPAPKPVPPKPSYVPFPGAAWFSAGRKSPVVLAMHKRLVAVGCGRYKSSAGADTIGSGDVDSYEAWQRKCGFSGAAASWPPGKSTWDALKVPR